MDFFFRFLGLIAPPVRLVIQLLPNIPPFIWWFLWEKKNVASDSHFCVKWQPHILSFKYWGVATQENYPDNEFLNVSMNLKRQLTSSFLNTPWKLINMEPEKHPFEKDVISQTSIVGFHVGFRGCKRCKALNLDLEIASNRSTPSPQPPGLQYVPLQHGKHRVVFCGFWTLYKSSIFHWDNKLPLSHVNSMGSLWFA